MLTSRALFPLSPISLECSTFRHVPGQNSSGHPLRARNCHGDCCLAVSHAEVQQPGIRPGAWFDLRCAKPAEPCSRVQTAWSSTCSDDSKACLPARFHCAARTCSMNPATRWHPSSAAWCRRQLLLTLFAPALTLFPRCLGVAPCDRACAGCNEAFPMLADRQIGFRLQQQFSISAATELPL